MRIFDLTRPLETGMPVYPGDPPVAFAPHAEYEHGFRVTRITTGTHAGTHVDAAAHFFPGGATVDRLPPQALVGPAVVVGLEGAYPEIEPGARVLVRSGWSTRWGAADYFTGFPGLPDELARRLLAAPAALLGLETPSLHSDAVEDARLHRALLARGVVIVENLVGLDALPERVFLAALPLPLRGLDGAPCRVVAWELSCIGCDPGSS